MAFAAHERRMVEPQKDGQPLRSHLQAAERQGSPVARAELAGPELPVELAHVWGWFLELHLARGSSGFGPAPIGYGEINAWAALKRLRPVLLEMECLVALDQLWLAPIKPKKGTA